MEITRVMEIYQSRMSGGEPIVIMDTGSYRNYFVFDPDNRNWVSIRFEDKSKETYTYTDFKSAKEKVRGALEMSIEKIERDEEARGYVCMALFELGMTICLLDYLSRHAMDKTPESVRKAMQMAHTRSPIQIIDGLKAMAGIEYEFTDETTFKSEALCVEGCDKE